MNIRALAAIFILIAASHTSWGMRCGTHLINEGDHVSRMMQLCGSPTSNTFSNIVYINKDDDGMNYYIHAQSNGIIDNIESSRGGLR